MAESPLTQLMLRLMRLATLVVAGLTGFVGLMLAGQILMRGTAPTGGEWIALGLMAAVVVASLGLVRAIGSQSGRQS